MLIDDIQREARNAVRDSRATDIERDFRCRSASSAVALRKSMPSVVIAGLPVARFDGVNAGRVGKQYDVIDDDRKTTQRPT